MEDREQGRRRKKGSDQSLLYVPQWALKKGNSRQAGSKTGKGQMSQKHKEKGDFIKGQSRNKVLQQLGDLANKSNKGGGFLTKKKTVTKHSQVKVLTYACNAPTPKAETGGKGASGLVD